MEYSLAEAYKLTIEHNIETNVQATINGNCTADELLSFALEGLNKNPNMYNVGISHPLITFEKFKHSMDAYTYYINHKKEWNDKGLYCDWAPIVNSLQFFRNEEQLKHFLAFTTDDGEPFSSFSASNIEYIDLYAGGFELKYTDGKISRNLFDKIK